MSELQRNPLDDFRRSMLLRGAGFITLGTIAVPAVLAAVAYSGHLGSRAVAPFISTATLIFAMVLTGMGIARVRKGRARRLDGTGLIALTLLFLGVAAEAFFALIVFLLWFGGSMLE